MRCAAPTSPPPSKPSLSSIWCAAPRRAVPRAHQERYSRGQKPRRWKGQRARSNGSGAMEWSYRAWSSREESQPTKPCGLLRVESAQGQAGDWLVGWLVGGGGDGLEAARRSAIGSGVGPMFATRSACASGARDRLRSGDATYGRQVRRRLSEMAEAASLSMIVPQPKYCVDNGVMVAWESGRAISRELRRRGVRWSVAPPRVPPFSTVLSSCIVRIAIARDCPPQAALIAQTFRVARPALRNLLLCFVPLRCGCRSDVPLSRAR